MKDPPIMSSMFSLSLKKITPRITAKMIREDEMIDPLLASMYL
jgi:hypothetical protein